MHMNSMMAEDTKNKFEDLQIYEGYQIKRLGSNLVEIKFNKGFEGELEDAKLIVSNLKKFCVNGNPILLLAVYAEDNSFSKEARNFVASKEVNKVVKAEALVINSMALRIMGNFYLKVNKPARESKLFNNRELALEWLKLR